MSRVPINVGVTQLRRILGDIDDLRAAAILSLNPTIEEIEQAAAWIEGRSSEIVGNGPWPLEGKAAEIFEILIEDEGDEETH